MQSMKSYKHTKNSLEGMLETNGTVEEYDFGLPEKALVSSSTSSSSLEG